MTKAAYSHNAQKRKSIQHQLTSLAKQSDNPQQFIESMQQKAQQLIINQNKKQQ